MPIINLVYEAPREWKPWANTIAYWSLDGVDTDYTWNYNMTVAPSSYQTLSSWKKVWQFSWYKAETVPDGIWTATFNRWNMTMSFWYRPTVTTMTMVFYFEWSGSWRNAEIDTYWDRIEFRLWNWSNWQWTVSASTTIIANTWYHIVLTYNGSKFQLYCNWTAIWTATSLTYPTWSWDNRCVLWYSWWTGLPNKNIMLWDFIIENKARTAQEISDYYNQTKSDYWL